MESSFTIFVQDVDHSKQELMVCPNSPALKVLTLIKEMKGDKVSLGDFTIEYNG